MGRKGLFVVGGSRSMVHTPTDPYAGCEPHHPPHPRKGPPLNPDTRARLSLAVAGAELSDLGRGVVADMSTPMRPGERIRKARRARLMSFTVVDRAVLVELAEGADWDTIADALFQPVDEVRRRYEPTWEQWLADDLEDTGIGDNAVGLRGDQDPAGTAATIDQWLRRHTDPWDQDPGPVARALIDGETASGDR